VKKLIIYGFLGMILLSSCGKNESTIEPIISDTIENSASSITLNHFAFIKSADVFATQVEKNAQETVYHSSFNIKNNTSNGNIAFDLKTTSSDLSLGDYLMNPENNQASISYTSNGMVWNSTLGHQKGSTFKVLSTRDLEAGSGYIKELTVQVNCMLYNAQGESIPFKCITNIKF